MVYETKKVGDCFEAIVRWADGEFSTFGPFDSDALAQLFLYGFSEGICYSE